MVLGRLFHRNAFEAQARSLYQIIVEQARRPEFYRHCGVPDTLDGRFELIALHAFLILHRLKADRPESADLHALLAGPQSERHDPGKQQRSKSHPISPF